MQHGEFIQNRWIVSAITQICKDLDISVHSYSHDWLMELSKGTQTQRVLGYKFPLNNGVAAQIAEDKVAAHTILDSQGIPSVPHLLVRTKAESYDTWRNNDWQDIVVKPLNGTSGIGVRRFSDQSLASQWIQAQTEDGWAVSPFVSIVREIRLIVLDGEVLLSYEKSPITIDGLPMFNLGLGATPTLTTVPPQLQKLAASALEALQLRLGSVDIVQLEDGSYKILEVNDGIMMEHFVHTSADYMSAGLSVYRAIIEKMFAAISDS